MSILTQIIAAVQHLYTLAIGTLTALATFLGMCDVYLSMQERVVSNLRRRRAHRKGVAYERE
jgi:hypothetical protein